MTFPFNGQVVIVTGASSGIGREVALQLAAQSARLVLVGRNADRLAATALACATEGRPAPHTVLAELSDEAECTRVLRECVQAHGRVDALVCAAGQAMKGRFAEADNAQATVQALRVNFDPVVYLCHAALPHLTRSQGRIVVVAGLLGHVAVPGYSAYAAAKHAVVGFCRSLRRELAGSGVALTLASPDTVRTSVRAHLRDASGRPAPEAYGDEPTMAATECARLILAAAAQRQPEVLMGRSRLLQTLQALLPGLLDTMLRKAAARGASTAPAVKAPAA